MLTSVGAQILDGKRIRDEILAELKPRIAVLAATRRVPGLGVVLVGHNPASEIYVRNKVKACEELGIYSEKITPPEDMPTEDLLGIVEGLNQRPEIDGILVQTPLPRSIDSRRVLDSILPGKDVDGFHPYNVGRLVAGEPGPRACTPAGVMELLRRCEIPIAGRRAVVVGRSDTVGKPMAMMLLHQNATVTICHSRTPDLAAECRRADILVAAVGRAALIRGDFIQPGATVVDVGMNRLDSAAAVEAVFGAGSPKLAALAKNGSVLVGDVHPLEVAGRAGAYTPVPGGVGPLTIAMLMANTVAAAERHLC
ncbi:MAG TPA: bifunctional methylenetetrahydrofolate dehydrogenase/methenyltetrahydrofolate cyclohydrolase FolD [Bryobacteraceae bacterium]|nr:bifunctional methylenetetrahydrofolate dehydrogenase/methenyltetrahydrofolate cyclohydrolase FolD [Bryobacteraceae bacterium]